MQLSLLKKILSVPTAPYREQYVVELVSNVLEKRHVPFFQDPVGNLVVGIKSKKKYLRLLRERNKDPLRIFIAHMDHPGFHGVKWLTSQRSRSSELMVTWLGGSPTRFLQGAGVWLADRSQTWQGKGRLQKTTIRPSGKGIDTAIVKLDGKDKPGDGLDAKNVFGGFRFRRSVWHTKNYIYSQALDDLAGVCSIITLACDYFSDPKQETPPFIGLLTRAEEVGFIGVIGHFELGWYHKVRRQLVCISIDTSRPASGVKLGKGPVIRTGDRFTAYDPDGSMLLRQVAYSVVGDRFQKQNTDSGSCEGSVALAYGIQTISLTLPIGNYHNISSRAGPDAKGRLGPGPEFIHKKDFQGLVKICREIIQPGLPWEHPWKDQIAVYKMMLRKSFKLLFRIANHKKGPAVSFLGDISRQQCSEKPQIDSLFEPKIKSPGLKRGEIPLAFPLRLAPLAV